MLFIQFTQTTPRLRNMEEGMKLSKMVAILIVILVMLPILSGTAGAACPNNPYVLQNGQNADATEVMANFNNLLTCINNMPQATVGSPVKLIGKVTSGTTVQYLADEIVVKSALGGNGKTLSNYNVTLDISANGAGGADVGTISPNTWVYIYAIAKTDGTSSILATTSGDGATVYGGTNMPDGYSLSSLIGAFKTDDATHVPIFSQHGRTVYFPELNVLSNGTQTEYSVVDMSSIIPKNALSWEGNVFAFSGGDICANFAADASGTGGTSLIVSFGPKSDSRPVLRQANNRITLPVVSPQTAYYKICPTSDRTAMPRTIASISVTAFSF